MGLLVVWVFRLRAEGGPIVQAAAVAETPGWMVWTTVIAGYVALVVIAIWPNVAKTSEITAAGDRGDLDRGE
jgi:hypothetical protein